ncbi:MAG TPA: hypothetical protein VGM44_07035 [Polyangiaceae bacterium]
MKLDDDAMRVFAAETRKVDNGMNQAPAAKADANGLDQSPAALAMAAKMQKIDAELAAAGSPRGMYLMPRTAKLDDDQWDRHLKSLFNKPEAETPTTKVDYVPGGLVGVNGPPTQTDQIDDVEWERHLRSLSKQ